MRKIIWIVLLVLSVSCKKECNETPGDSIQKEVEVSYFEKIIINTGVELILRDTNSQRLIVETGENRFNNVHITVVDKELEILADESCFLNPSFDAVKVFIDSPNIIAIRNSSEHSIRSNGILTYPELKLFSEDYQNGFNNIGNFDLKVNNDKVYIVSNGSSIIKIEGNTTNLNLLYYAGFGRFEGKDLIAQNVKIFHRGENSLKIYPQESLKGDIYATGDVLSYKRPPVVEVTEHFMGRLLFE